MVVYLQQIALVVVKSVLLDIIFQVLLVHNVIIQIVLDVLQVILLFVLHVILDNILIPMELALHALQDAKLAVILKIALHAHLAIPHKSKISSLLSIVSNVSPHVHNVLVMLTHVHNVLMDILLMVGNVLQTKTLDSILP